MDSKTFGAEYCSSCWQVENQIVLQKKAFLMFWFYESIDIIVYPFLQVAEMHGELMEFNEVLHRQLNTKEATISRLKKELTDLRGPVSIKKYFNNYLFNGHVQYFL